MGACARRRRGLAASALVVMLLPAGMPAWAASETSRLSDEPISYRGDNELPLPTPPIFELGDVFLRPGNIKPGFELPTGAVWQPRFWVFGTIRSSLATFDNGIETQMELEGRLIAANAGGPDGREGMDAFLSKRAPNFA